MKKIHRKGIASFSLSQAKDSPGPFGSAFHVP